VLTQNVYSIGTAAVNVVNPTNSLVNYKIKNLQPEPRGEDYARQGYVYNLHSTFTVARNTSVSFTVLTGPTGLQIEFYQIISSSSNVRADLIEGATVTPSETSISTYNINRNFPDDAQAVFNGVTSFTGGTVVVSEYITAAKDGGGGMAMEKIITLEPNTRYVFRFTELSGNEDPSVFFEMGFSERYNGYHDIWLETVDDSFVLRGGEQIKMKLLPGESINATSLVDYCKLSVMRQE
jgi:hypothetical protein